MQKLCCVLILNVLMENWEKDVAIAECDAGLEQDNLLCIWLCCNACERD